MLRRPVRPGQGWSRPASLRRSDSQPWCRCEMISWASLQSAFDHAPVNAGMSWQTCSANTRYETLMQTLSRERPVVDLSVAGSPLEGKHLLFFGNSFLKQIVDNLLAAHLTAGAAQWNIELSHNISFTGGKACRAPMFLSMAATKEMGMDMKSYSWALPNFSFTMITNCGPLQHSTCLNQKHQESLWQLLHLLPPIHAIVFMQVILT
jgi:hypothetical protein